MKNNNRGFTLVELIVAISIFGILAAAVFGFMIAGANSYGRINTRLNLQMNAELAANQIEEYMRDCNGSIYYDNNSTLYIINSNEGESVLNAFEYKDGKIKYGTAKLSEKPNGSYAGYAIQTDALLCKNVDSFDVNLGISDERAYYAELKLQLKQNGKRYTVEKVVALRNRPIVKAVI